MEIKEQLLEKGWNEEALIYANQVKLTKEKSEKDKILREIESQKQRKQMEYDQLTKSRVEDIQIRPNVEAE